MRLPYLALVVAVSVPTGVIADTREERLVVAQEYVELTLSGMDMAAVIASMWMPIVQQMETSGTTVTQPQRDALQAVFMEQFEQPMFEIMKAQSDVMADVMTLAEITSIRDFYATPEGRSVMMKLPQLAAAQQPMIMTLMTDNMPAILPKVEAILQP